MRTPARAGEGTLETSGVQVAGPALPWGGGLDSTMAPSRNRSEGHTVRAYKKMEAQSNPDGSKERQCNSLALDDS